LNNILIENLRNIQLKNASFRLFINRKSDILVKVWWTIGGGLWSLSGPVSDNSKGRPSTGAWAVVQFGQGRIVVLAGVRRHEAGVAVGDAVGAADGGHGVGAVHVAA
jgi:hypothetical protein